MRHSMLHTMVGGGARLLVGTLLPAVLLSATAGLSASAQLIPSVGFTKSMDSSAGGGKLNGGLALRVSVLPFLKAEGGIAYRDQSFSNGDLKVRTWPVTASLWLAPVPLVYAGGGVGWYRTTYDYRSTLPIKDTTTSKLGVHLGGGLAMPLAPPLGLDLNGRYIFLQKDNNITFPAKFNPEFWNLSLGLALTF